MGAVTIGNVTVGNDLPLSLIAGPCAMEGREHALEMADRLTTLADSLGFPLIYKSSFDKANRTSLDSPRGIGIEAALDIFAEIKERFGCPVLTDVHTEAQCAQAATVVDVLQIPAFLCRQTDLLLAAAATGRAVNVKKGQFLAPGDMTNVVAKLESTGNRKIIVTERGVSFGYNNLVADMRSLLELRELGYPVTFDATHSVQRPGGAGTRSGGDGCWAPYLARAAVAVGCDAVFIETHVNPAAALSDGANAIRFSGMRKLWKTLRAIDDVVS